MRYQSLGLVFAIILAFFTLHGAIDIRSSAQQDSMSSTSLAPNAEVPREMGTLTIDGSLELETLFFFIGRPLAISIASKRSSDPKLYSF
ncbi:uncharacterized protein FSUBG_9696 [Fusarium subglutinans]|uniref:Uncharacterized protein n=1 Tax=Gibberella subglutinans TaxID=42677 RepID=A0A8H5PBZ8_GIBSU|nr:uncharacterized protein FSUBG_9696 [Fusarium subglutinans]KAF5593788.1 hypothetical protein FSUBG_9696 [Fusarium subglutinans]